MNPHNDGVRRKGVLPAFTLTELLVVLVIIGILVVIVLPDQTSVIAKAKATEAKMQLEHLHSLEKAHFFEFSKYSDSMEEIGFEQQKTVRDGGNANYSIKITDVSSAGFTATATSEVDFDQDGNFNSWEINEEKKLKEITQD